MVSHNVSRTTMIATYISFALLILVGHIRDQLGKLLMPWRYRHFTTQGRIPAIYTRYESFFVRRIFRRISDCCNRPVSGSPSKFINVLERISNDGNETFILTGKTVKALNMGSYNYLGFTDMNENHTKNILETIDNYGIGIGYSMGDYQSHPLVNQLENEMAEFLHRDACIVFSMGFGTNTWAISTLMYDSLIFSDEYNHSSLVVGMKLSLSRVVIFKHNNLTDLEDKLIENIAQGQPETHHAWNRIFVVVEGIYSMEGTMADIPQLIKLKKKYKFYLYVDEAHSIGAIGYTGRGICEHKGVDFKDVDILMGTFSKSFASSGGYIASSREVVNYLRATSDGALYAEQLAPACCMQVLLCLRTIRTDQSRIRQLAANTSNMRRQLKKYNLSVIGDESSPVVPVLAYNPAKIAELSRLCLSLGLAVVVVGYPATPIVLSRVRLCLSALHTDEDIERTADIIGRLGRILGLQKQ